MKKTISFVALISLIISLLANLGCLININESSLWENYIGLGELADILIFIFMSNVIFQGLFYSLIFILFLINIKIEFSPILISIRQAYFLNITLFIIWVGILNLFQNNGKLDLILGPADSGLFLLSLFSIVTNYYYLSLLLSKKLEKPVIIISIIENKIFQFLVKIKSMI